MRTVAVRTSLVASVSLAALVAAACSGGRWGFGSDSVADAQRSATYDELVASFRSPPASARPHTWWHWMNGNVTREGITADLEAMHRIGLGGAQIFNVSESIPEGPVAYNSDEWRALVKHAASEAARLGLELCIHNCAGWSSSGGPWVKPEFAMQTLVASETKLHGPVHFADALAQPPTKHDFYRDVAVLAFPTPKDDATRLAEWQVKALDDSRYGVQPSLAPTPAAAAITRGSIVDLTKQCVNGKLEWDVPAGDWTVLRFGHTPTGAVNAPAPTVGRGLEVDKLSREAFDQYWAGGMAPLIRELGPLAGTSLKNVLIDSYEVGCQNWSPKFREEFTKRRGYDPIVYLPTTTGRIVENGETSERFLWDLRRTVGDLFTENYYAYFSQTCRQNGLLSSIEPYDGPFECSEVARDADVVMGEFWVTSGMSYSCKLAASVAHTHGKKFVGSESFTAEPGPGRWLNVPSSLKAVGDLMYSEGINRFIVHRYAHQPWQDVAPGMTMGQWGTHFERTTTWWEPGRAWIDYLTRCQSLLQQGRFAADVLEFAGECSPNNAPHDVALKAKGYDYDTCGPDVLEHRLTVKDGRLVLPDGTSYRVLLLPDLDFATPELARAIANLVANGATVVAGKAPSRSPSLAGLASGGAGDAEVALLALTTWTNPRVHTGKPVEQLLAEEHVEPDCSFTSSRGNPSVAWIHRVVSGGAGSDGDLDVYFVANQKKQSDEVDCSFRVAGKSPELWRADTATIEPAPLWRESNGRTIVPIHFDPTGSCFVVFRRTSGATADHLVAIELPSKVGQQRRAPKLAIVKAVYEAVDGAGGADVTAKVASQVAAGVTEIAATNSAFGDPTVNHAKQLRVDYTLDGKATTRTVEENGLLALLDTSGPDVAPPFTLAPSNDGGVELHAFEPGAYVAKSASGRSFTLGVDRVPAPIAIEGPWNVRFQPKRGAPDHATFATLASWTDSTDFGVKYFSGTATYEKEFELSSDFGNGASSPRRVVVLDLGVVRELAEVKLDGVELGVLWKSPFSVDVTKWATPGRHRLEVRVTNTWVNRLIGDEQFPPDEEWQRQPSTPLKQWPSWFDPKAPDLAKRPVKERITFTTWKHWSKESQPLPSGLLGPVTLRIGIVNEIGAAR